MTGTLLRVSNHAVDTVISSVHTWNPRAHVLAYEAPLDVGSAQVVSTPLTPSYTEPLL